MRPIEVAPPSNPAAVRCVAESLSGASPQEVLTWALDAYGEDFCLTTSLADAVLIDMVSGIRPDVAVLFIDTDYHFPETLDMRAEVAQRYPVRLISVRPRLTIAEQSKQFGPALFRTNPDQCCALRKVEPLNKALAGYRAWASGIRRDEGRTRWGAAPVEWDGARRMVKVNPLANWTQDQVDTYIAEQDVPVNPLAARGYLSIGCAPCTSPVAPGADARSGRWAGHNKTECGLHTPRRSGDS